MENIELVVKMDEDTYKNIIKNGFIYDEDNEVVTYAIKNGTPLEEELHREKEQAYYLGYEDGRKSERTAVAESENI